MKAVHDNAKLPYRQKMVKLITERLATNEICSMKTGHSFKNGILFGWPLLGLGRKMWSSKMRPPTFAVLSWKLIKNFIEVIYILFLVLYNEALPKWSKIHHIIG